MPLTELRLSKQVFVVPIEIFFPSRPMRSSAESRSDTRQKKEGEEKTRSDHEDDVEMVNEFSEVPSDVRN